MKTIKILLASSEELTDDRNAFGNLIRRLKSLGTGTLIHAKASYYKTCSLQFLWRNLNRALGKEDPYNEIVS